VKIAEIDRVSRDFIARQGYGRNFGHNLGHGVGLQIHEAPSISPGASGVLKPGMVFTLEPAVYLTGRFGIRIEDMVLVTKKGCEVLSGFINQ
jgi:Xaa-Pro aminopeptidase